MAVAEPMLRLRMGLTDQNLQSSMSNLQMTPKAHFRLPLEAAAASLPPVQLLSSTEFT